MALDGRAFQLGRGETLDIQFAVKDNGAYVDLDSYTVSLSVELDGGTVSFGAVSIVSGSGTTPDKVRLLVTAAESAALAEGVYAGKITRQLTASPYTTVEDLLFTCVVYEDSRHNRIPMNEQAVCDVLKVDKSSVGEDQLRRIMRLAENRVLQWLPEQIATWCNDNGWPDRIVSEAEQVAALLLRRELYDNDQMARDDLREAQATISGMTLDMDMDGTREEGNSSEVKIVRDGRAVTRKIWDRGRLRMTNPIPLMGVQR
jgi:hypothetical protein